MTENSNRHRFKIIILFMLLLNAGCSTIGILVDGGSGAPGPGPGARSYPSYRSLKIPPGHLPPPGQCRVWYPGKPPGHQPPPTSCESAIREAGIDTWVLHRTTNDSKILEVKEKKGTHPKVEIVIRHYAID